MSKLREKAKSSKLSETSLQTNSIDKPKEERLLRQINIKEYPRSYRIDYETMNILKDTLCKINELSPKKISEARLIKALILLSKEIDENIIIRALKEVW